jgi:tetratricopeptide (TPR) repeat protein
LSTNDDERPETGPDETAVGKARPSSAREARASRAEGTLAPGTRAGRYLLLDRLGGGGGGVVYSAYDPQLERKVAIKLLRPDASVGDTATEGRARLLREGQAMAKLKHPNVLPVFDVGTLDHDGHSSVFVAMELVEGGTLRSWLGDNHRRPASEERGKQPRSRREVLEVMLAAGRGLAAAHAQGLVHRDFKPDNVLVDSDGRVYVTDFGIVRATGTRDALPSGPSPSDSLSTPLTRADAVVGTPAYMAPEQYRAEAVDARTDQFSFCVTLYEALTGERPFRGKTFEDLEQAACTGKLTPAARHAQIPAWLRRVVLRGLSVDPAARHADMAALLDALADDPTVRRRRVALVIAGVTACAGLAIGMVRYSSRNHELCRGAERKLEGVWDAQTRERLASAFRSVGVSPRLTASVSAALDGWAQKLVAMHVETCEATRVRAVQSEPVMALRMACLDGRLKELRSLTTLLVSADLETARKSLEAASRLTPIDGCADVAALSERVPPPSDPAVRREVERVRGRIAEARPLVELGRYEKGLQILDEVAQDASKIGYPPLRAEALVARGTALEASGRTKEARAVLEEGVSVAYGAHDDALVARAASSLSSVLGYWLALRSEGHVWNRLAGAAIERLGGADDLEIDRAWDEATVLTEEGSYAQSIAQSEHALKLAERLHGPESLEAAELHITLAGALDKLQRLDEARTHARRAVELFEKLLGPDHPKLVTALNSLGNLLDSEDHYVEAEAVFRRAIAIGEASLGPDHPQVAIVLANLSGVLLELHRYAEALPPAERALAIQEKKFGRDYTENISPLQTIGMALGLLHQPAEAVRVLERALRLCEAGEVAPFNLAGTRQLLAEALWEQGDHARARKLSTQARDAYRALGPAASAALPEVETWLKQHR